MKKVTINDQQFKIKKLPLGRYADVLSALQKLPEHIAGLDDLDEEKMISSIPTIGAEVLPEFLEVTAIATGIDQEEIENEMGLADLVLLWEAILEVNDFQLVKKVIGRLRRGTKNKKGGSKES